jgi:hypothetical protein
VAKSANWVRFAGISNGFLTKMTIFRKRVILARTDFRCSNGLWYKDFHDFHTFFSVLQKVKSMKKGVFSLWGYEVAGVIFLHWGVRSAQGWKRSYPENTSNYGFSNTTATFLLFSGAIFHAFLTKKGSFFTLFLAVFRTEILGIWTEKGVSDDV